MATIPVLARRRTSKQDDVSIAAACELQAAAPRLADRAGYE